MRASSVIASSASSAKSAYITRNFQLWRLPSGHKRSFCTTVKGRSELQREALVCSMKNIFSGVMSSFDQNNGPSGPSLSFSSNAPTWEALKEIVKSQQSELEVNFWRNFEEGDTNPYALKRTFGKSGEIRLKLYRDHAGWCPYCQKVWLQLEEKQIPYVLEKINMRCYGDKPASFTAKVPNGLLPVIELDGRVVTESAVIMALLEEKFPERPLMPPAGTPERQRADALMRLERRIFSDWLSWLTSGWNPDAAKRSFEATLSIMEKELDAAGGPYFMGSDISLVDITFVPMVERMVASLAYYKGYMMRGTGRWPNVERWFAALETRPTYLGMRSDHYTHCHDLPPQLGGCVMTPQGEPVAAKIDGSDGSSWRLPLAPLSASSQPECYSPGDNPRLDCLEAAAKLVSNHAAVVKFALRGPGEPGPRPVSAPLADPTAIAAPDNTGSVDMALRHVIHAMLIGVEAKQASEHALQVTAGPGLDTKLVIPSAEYLRDRVGVPRDMKFPAARQLRAHLNWLIDTLQA